jgi:hypothetical protein
MSPKLASWRTNLVQVSVVDAVREIAEIQSLNPGSESLSLGVVWATASSGFSSFMIDVKCAATVTAAAGVGRLWFVGWRAPSRRAAETPERWSGGPSCKSNLGRNWARRPFDGDLKKPLSDEDTLVPGLFGIFNPGG